MLIDALEDYRLKIKEKHRFLSSLYSQYQKSGDVELLKDIERVKKEIAHLGFKLKLSLLEHLEEFKLMKKYYPQLLAEYAQDAYIGRYVRKRLWLLELAPLNERSALAAFNQVKEMRATLKKARAYLKLHSLKQFEERFPFLKGAKDREQAFKMLEEMDKRLILDGWRVIISSPLITAAVARYALLIQEFMKKRDGTRYLTKKRFFDKKIKKYSSLLTQVLLANPSYLRELQRKPPSPFLKRFVSQLRSVRVNERQWLREMAKRLESA